MSDTKRKNDTKKELVTADIHRKAGPHKVRKPEPKVCPFCRGAKRHLINLCLGCQGEGIIYE